MKKVNLLCLAVLALFFSACHSNDDTWGDWSRSTSFGGWPRTEAVSFVLNGVPYVGLGHNRSVEGRDKTLKDFWKYENNTWEQVADFPTDKGRFGAVAFVVQENGKDVAYVGTGFHTLDGTETYYKDFYRFDGENWTQAPPLPEKAPARKYAVAFSVGGKGYVGTGQGNGSQVMSDYYCYDPATQTWKPLGSTGDTRYGASAFVIGNKAVVCLGSAGGNTYRTDVLIYDAEQGRFYTKEDANGPAPLVNQDGRGWDNDYGRIPRAFAIAFTSNLDGGKTRGYVATGIGSYAKTCWEYDIERDRWDEVTELPAMMGTRQMAVAFSLNQYGYVVTGGSASGEPTDGDMWKFTPGIDEDEDNDY